MVEPLVPEEITLRGLPWMRLDTARLLDSDLFALSTGDEFKAAVALWCKSWSQEPAGSLPTDDRILAHLSGAGNRWKKVKPMALRGWTLAKDGKLYHPVVAEQVLAAWNERVEFREKIEGQNARQRRLREERAALSADLKANGIHLAWNVPIDELRARHAELSQPVTPETDLSRACHGDSHGLDGTGRDGTVLRASTSNNPSAHRSSGGAAAHALALRGEGYSNCSPHDPDLLAAAGEGITPEELAAAAHGRPGKPIAWVVQRARGRRADAAARQAEGRTAAPAAPPPPDPEAVARQAAADRLDDLVRKIRQDCDVLGLITPAERDRRIAEAQAEARAGQPARATA